MVISSAIDVFCWMRDVKHFVINHAFDDKQRDIGRIERAADRNVAMGSIMMAEYPIGFPGGPRERRLLDRISKILNI